MVTLFVRVDCITTIFALNIQYSNLVCTDLEINPDNEPKTRSTWPTWLVSSAELYT